MSELPPNIFEEEPEFIPTPEEVQTVFEQLVKGEEYEDTRKLEDERGLYLYEIVLLREDGNIEYSYRRGRTEEDEIAGLRIDVIYFDEDDIPVGGHPVAKYIDGEWRFL